MRAASAGTIALLNSSVEFIMADLYTLTTISAAGATTVARYTSYNIPITLSGNTFLAAPNAPVITRGRIRTVAGLEVDTLDVTLGCAQNFTTLPGLAAAGYFDGATLKIERVFMSTPGVTTDGSVVLFTGSVSAALPSSTAVRLVVKATLEKLSVQMPRNLFQTACSHVLYDPGCALVKATYTVAGVVGAVSSVTSFRSNLGQATDYFRLGTGIFTSGALVGVPFSVKSFANTNGVVGVAQALTAAPANGDTFTIAPGCDKSSALCVSRFNNLAHYRGFPWIPSPEATR